MSGVIDSITPQAVIVRVKSKGFLKGTVSTEHLADHHGMCFLSHERTYELCIFVHSFLSFFFVCRASKINDVTLKTWI